MIKIYEVWDFPQTSQYSLKTKEGGLFSKCVDDFMELKLNHSVWLSSCVSDEDKEKYIANVYEKEGIKLEKSKICYNSGLRAQAKIMLNSFWGKFGQKNDLSLKKIVHTKKELLDLFCDDSINVDRIVEISDMAMLVTFTRKN